MSQTFLTPDRLYDRPWRAGHPFSRSPSAKRRWTMLALFAVLCTIIGGYLYITDARRVRAMAESELGKIIGGPVSVGRAKLSLFEGLRLENVSVYVDNSGDHDACVFSANTFNVSYDPKALLTGRLKLTQIVAIDPHVTLSENLDTGRWNYQRMSRPRPTATAPSKPGQMPALPEIILRNAQIEYSEVRDDRPVSHASMVIEGQFAPSSDGHTYTFEMQSRGGTASGGVGTPLAENAMVVGPAVTGKLDRRTGVVTAALRYFQFGRDIRSMLPAQVRSWWDRHELSGAVDIPLLSYTPATATAEPTFTVQTAFHNVNLTVRPEEWMSRDEVQTHQWAAQSFDVLRQLGMNSAGVVDQLAHLIEPAPIQLQQVGGTFTFTEDGIVIGQQTPDHKTLPVSGALEQNVFAISGHIDGYSPLSPASITISSEKTQIPANPRYVTSMPPQVRELYDHLRPQGVCSLQMALSRPGYGGRLEIAGGVNIIDGNFVFDRFPYPVRNATGQVTFGHDDATGWDQVRLVDLKGRGVAGGPNADSLIHLSGLISPLTSDVGVQITVAADQVRDEPALNAAFPEEVREALRNLDADGKGLYPKFNGAFECRVNRAVGPHSPWLIETDVTLRDSAGKPVAFPYLMEHVNGQLRIREGYVDIVDATMKKGDASLVLGGRVIWRAGAGGTPLEPGEVEGKVIPSRPDLKITARGVPIDKDLLEALPPDRREWLQKVGLTGLLDIDGRIWRPGAAEAAASTVARSHADSELTHTFELTLRDGSIWPIDGGAFALSHIGGKLRLLPDRLIISEMTGKRGEADLLGRGEVSWPQNKPAVFVSGTANKLRLDHALYSMLPRPAQTAWDAVKPEGTVDVDLTYHGALGVEGASRVSGVGVRVSGQDKEVTSAATIPSSPEARNPRPETRLSNLDLIIHPVKLAATVQAVPYRLEDITGTVRLRGGKISLTDLAGRHGAGTVRISGSGAADKTDWDLRVGAENVTVDDAFRKAVPGGLATVINGLKLGGTIGFEFPKLTIKSSPPGGTMQPGLVPPPAPRASTAATTAPDSTPLDVDFAVKVAFNGATIDLGVPATGIDGEMQLEGTVRNSKLAALSGPIDLPTLTISGRNAGNLHAEFFKPEEHDALRIGRITGDLAGGHIAGQVDLGFPDVGPSRYIVNLVLRNADVRQLSGDLSPDLSGELSASLALEGDWSDPRSRRGRGDVAVTGKEMYKIPLVLGLLQVTNLSLPISAPFNQGSARYNVDGQTVTFESLELRSRDMLMSGSGQLNFATKQVKMTFFTDNPNWPKLPILGDIVQTAKHELLQIHVKGTLEEPKVSATPANTLTTTVDEVLRGNGSK